MGLVLRALEPAGLLTGRPSPRPVSFAGAWKPGTVGAERQGTVGHRGGLELVLGRPVSAKMVTTSARRRVACSALGPSGHEPAYSVSTTSGSMWSVYC